MSLVTACREAMERLTEASEGALTGAERISYGFHLALCPHCKKYRAQLNTTVKTLQAMPREAAVADDVSAVLALLKTK